jgi:hypothetical protein
MARDLRAGHPGVVVRGAYMTLLAYEVHNIYVLDPRFYDTEDPESVATYKAREAELNRRAEAVIAGGGQRSGVRRPWPDRQQHLAAPAGVPMFAKTLENRRWFHQGSFKVTSDDVVTPSDLLPPSTLGVVGPNDPLPDEWPCEPTQPSIVTANRVAPR